MTWLDRLLLRWWMFFFPVRGWRDRYEKFLRGQRVWPIEADPTLPPTIPFPLAWVPVQWERDESKDKDFFRLCSSTSLESGNPLPVGEGVRCLRCGIELHEREAHMYGAYDPPQCPRCRRLLQIIM